MVDCPGGGWKFGCPVAQWAHWDKPARACSEMAISSSKQSKERSAGCWDPFQGISLLLGRSIPGVWRGRLRQARRGEARRRGGKSVRVEQRRVNGEGKEGKRKEGKAEPGEGRGEGDEAALRTSHRAPVGSFDPAGAPGEEV